MAEYTSEFPFYSDTGSNTDSPGWVNASVTYATLGSPAADQPEVQIVATIPAGNYLFGMSMTNSTANENNPPEFRFTLDGGASWENGEQPWAFTGVNAYGAYTFPLINHAGGAINMAVQVRTGGGTGATNCHFLNVWLNRVG